MATTPTPPSLAALARPSPNTVGATMFNDLERLAIRLGAEDPPLSPPRTPIRRLMARLWLRQRAAALEDARLETLRQLVSTLKYGSHDATLDALLRTRAVGFDGPQIRAVVMLYGSVRLRHHILAEEPGG